MLKNILVGLLAVVVLAIGGRAFWAYQQMKAEEQKVSIFKTAIKNSTQNISAIAFTATTTGEVAFDPKDASFGVSPGTLNFVLAYGGNTDFHSKEKTAFDMTFDVDASLKMATSSGALAFSLHQIVIDKDAYMNLQKFNLSFDSSDPKMAGAQMVVGVANGAVKSFANKWIHANASEYIATSTASFATLPSEQKFKDYFARFDYVTALTMLGKETLAGMPVYHIKATIQNTQELVDLVRQATLAEDPSLASKDSFNKDMDNFAKLALQKIDIDLWIGQDDLFIHKFITSPVFIDDQQDGVKMNIKHEMSISSYNNPVSVVAPQGAQSVEEIVNSILGGLGVTNNARDQSVDATIKADLANARAAGELYFDSKSPKSYKKVCSSDFFVTAKQRIAQATGAQPICNDSVTAWAMSAPLKSDPRVYWCVDNLGDSGPSNKPLGKATKCSIVDTKTVSLVATSSSGNGSGPTARLAINGVPSVSVKEGETYTMEWASTNATKGSMLSVEATKCADNKQNGTSSMNNPFPTAKGSRTMPKADRNMMNSLAKCVVKYTYTVADTTGKIVQSSAEMRYP